MANKIICWSKTATKQFETAITNIALDSKTNAEKVVKDILKELEKVLKNPEFFPPD